MAKNIFSSLKIKYSTNGNKPFGLDDMLNVILAACLGNDKRRSIDGQCRILRGARKKGDRKIPSRQWVFGMINGVRSDYMMTRCKIMLGKSVLQARRRGMLRGPVDVLIDMHDVPLYAKIMRLVYAIKSRSKHGIDTFNRLATLHCVTNNQRLTLAVEIVRREDETADVVGRMLDWCARHGINISSLTMDRGFYSVAVINAVKKRGVPMIMPAVKNSRTLDKIKQHHSEEIGAVTEHTISSENDSATFNLIIIKRNKKDVSAKDDTESKILDELYKNKDDGNSKDPIGKKYYVFATTMYGEWMREGGDPHVIAEFYKKH